MMSEIVNYVSKISALRAGLLNMVTEPSKSVETVEVMEIDLEDGAIIKVDTRDKRAAVWQEFLKFQQDKGLSIFVQAEKDSGIVHELLPVFSRPVDVVDPRPIDGRLRVTFLTSPAIFFLNPALPRFSELREKLESAARENATVLETHHPLTFEIIDVREAAAETSGPAPGQNNVLSLSVPAVTLQQAFVVFGHLKRSDIPFFYLTDCCTARAHRMCDLLRQNHNIEARKIWNFGQGYAFNKRTLCVKTPLAPSGEVCWTFHVAPIIGITDDPVGTVVLDPSLFDTPVAISTWLAIQTDQNAVQEFTDARNYSNKPNSTNDVLDPKPERVQTDLNGHTGSSILVKALNELIAPPIKLRNTAFTTTQENKKWTDN